MKPRLVFELLGVPRIHVDGQPLEVDTRKAVAMASYLAVEAHQPTRDELVSLLWPELDAERGRAALRRTLSTLRTSISAVTGDDEVIEANRDRIALDRSELWLDIEEARRLSAIDHSHGSDKVCPECVESLQVAAKLYRGPFMHGFYLRDSFAFEDWQRNQAELHRRNWRDLVDRWALALASGGRFGEAAEVTQRRLDTDPLDEAGHRRLMQYLVWQGDRVGALRQYRECAILLDRELGVPPLPDTRELYEEILEGVEPLPPAGRVELAPVGRPLRRDDAADRTSVGRKEELSLMAVATGHLFFEGEEGIGKSDLIERFLVDLPGPIAVCAPPPGAEEVAYLAITEVLGEAARFNTGDPPAIASEAVRLLPELGGSVFAEPRPADSGPGAAARFHSGVVAALDHLLSGGTLVVEDAQWLDQSSIAVLGLLLSRPTRLRVIMSWRTGELAAPLSALVNKLERAGTGSRFQMTPLSDNESWELLSLRAEPGIPASELESIVDRSGGNPLFLLSYLGAVGSSQAELPAGIEELIGARLNRLSDQALQVLSAAAIIGPEFDLDDARVVSGRGAEEMIPALEELLVQRLVVESHDGITFGHDAVRRAVCRRLSKARTRILHGRAGDRLRLSDSMRAVHLEAAGKAAEAAIAHGEAGLAAIEVHAYESARSHLTSALELGHPAREQLGKSLGLACVRLGDYGAALAAYDTVPEDADIAHRVGEIYMRLGRLELAAASWEQAAALDPDEGLLSRITADRALAAHRRGDRAGAQRLIAEAVGLASSAEDRVARARAAGIAGMIKPEKLEIVEAACALSEETGRNDLIAAALNNLALAQRRAGLIPESIGNARRALAILEPVGDRHQLAALHNNLADTLHQAGDEEGAQTHLAASASLFASVGLEPGGWEPEVWMLSEW
ncbi:MAG: AAA family ATPase [Acidimicrobiia bacterium]|nr:AAA family ATPase [Acidimicrobiia bacterium]MDQ3499713.1 tetratricopeptide repeat protein [Actinomycetota bacterium]